MVIMKIEMVEAAEAVEMVVVVVLNKDLVPNRGGTKHSELFTAEIMELVTIWVQTNAIQSQVIRTTQLLKIV